MKLRSERFVSTFLDPGRRFAPTEVTVEVRWDPLLGHAARLLPPGSIPPPEPHDLAELAEETSAACPFCRDALERATPCFPWGDRIRRGEVVLFPNLVPYAK